MKPLFLYDWNIGGLESLKCDFNITFKELEGINILLASYDFSYEYGGEAFVLFEKDGKLYEVNASYDIYYGLEGQWEPEETTIEALKYRLTEGNWDEKYFSNGLKKVLEEYEMERK